MKVTSSGCIRCVQWGGKQSIMTPFSLARSISSRLLVCVACPSKINRTFLSFVAPENWMNSFIQSINMWVWIHPLRWHSYVDPGGAPSISSAFILTLGKMSFGGMYDPTAEQQMLAVINCPLSAEVSPPTCRFPFVDITRDIVLGTVVMPVSSVL